MSCVDAAIAKMDSEKKAKSKNKVDWTGSPVQKYQPFKNKKGSFGENLYAIVSGGTVLHKDGSDVFYGESKVEVKTCFQNTSEDFWFNQIKPNKGWNKLAFVFVWPNRVEIWEINKNEIVLGEDIDENSSSNGFSWRAKDSSRLSESANWKRIYAEEM
jgi:hypothetical protein